MLDFSDQPYCFFPPRRSAFVVRACTWLNRWHLLPRLERFRWVETSGGRPVRELQRRGARLLLMPNHPTHSDAAIIFEAMRQTGLRAHFMAAYDLFYRSRLRRWLLQRAGAFSIDREGSDKQALRQAVELLEARAGLVIFPEGNVYLQNDRVTPFHEGAALVALRVAKKLAADRQLYAVPVSIKATHLDDVADRGTAALARMAADVGADGPSGGRTRLEYLHHVGVAALRMNLEARGFEIQQARELPEIIERSAGVVLGSLEAKIGIPDASNSGIFERVRAVRARVHEVRIDPDREADHRIAAAWADEAMLAFKIGSYAGNYVSSNPTVDRFSETVEKLEEDVYSRVAPAFADRGAYVRFGAPVAVAPYLRQQSRLRAACAALTGDIEREVQVGIDLLNARNPYPGGSPLE